MRAGHEISDEAVMNIIKNEIYLMYQAKNVCVRNTWTEYLTTFGGPSHVYIN